MSWVITRDREEFECHAESVLLTDPVNNTIALTVLDALRSGRTYSDQPPSFGWYVGGSGSVSGAVLVTPPHPLVLAVVPAGAMGALVVALRDAAVEVPGAGGAAGGIIADPATEVATRPGDGRLWVWEADGHPVSMAGRTVTIARVARIGPVYTPPQRRRHGYGAAVTAACTADALDRGATDVVLFTDLANPTSNAIYQEIGYRPVRDNAMIRYVRPVHLA